MPRVRIQASASTSVAFPWGTVPVSGSKEFDLTDQQLEVLTNSLKLQASLPKKLFSFEVLESIQAEDSVPKAVTAVMPEKQLDDMDVDELREVYRQRLGDPGKRNRKALLKELRRANG